MFTCAHQDDGYAGTLKNSRDWNEVGQLGRSTDPLQPGQVRFLLRLVCAHTPVTPRMHYKLLKRMREHRLQLQAWDVNLSRVPMFPKALGWDSLYTAVRK